MKANQRYLDVALGGEVLRVSKAQPSQRNKTLFSATVALGELVHAGLDGQTIRDRMVEAAIQNGLVSDDGMTSVLKTIQSGLRTGMDNPRAIAANDCLPPPRAQNRRPNRIAIPPSEIAVTAAYSAWTSSEGGEQPSYVVGKGEPPSLDGEVER
jgi:hypothetical protein